MATRQQVSWAQLRVGVMVLTALSIFALMIFLMSGEGTFTRKATLRVFMDNAAGLKKGDPVRLTGIDIGNVQEIRISGEHDASRAVMAVLSVQRRFLDEIRTDSVATLEAESLLGQRYFDITRGTPAKPALQPDAELNFKSRPDYGDVMATGATVLTNLNRVINQVGRVTDTLSQGQGTLGKLFMDDALYRRADSAVADFQKMAQHASSGQGSLGKLIYTDEIFDRANSAVGKLDQIADDVKSGQGSLGKLLYDPALYDDTRQIVARANEVVGDVQAGKGSLGKFIKDEALYNKATSAVDRIDTIAGRMEKGEGSMGRFLRDDAFYNNTNQLSLEVRELLADFRKDPKKFLTIKFKLF
jgi:phospholipid/cholesterol/gamma-HCH transport system substrate-binding protein